MRPDATGRAGRRTRAAAEGPLRTDGRAGAAAQVRSGPAAGGGPPPRVRSGPAAGRGLPPRVRSGPAPAGGGLPADEPGRGLPGCGRPAPGSISVRDSESSLAITGLPPGPAPGPPGPPWPDAARPPAPGVPGRGMPGCGRPAPGSISVRDSESSLGSTGLPPGPGAPGPGPPAGPARIRPTSARSASRCRIRSASSARTDSRSARAAARALPRISAASSSAACRMFCMRSVNVPIVSPWSPRERGAGRGRGPGPGGGGGGRQARARPEPRRRDERQRLAARHLQIGTHPRQHPLEPGHVLVYLLAVVAAQNDVETWGAWPPHICRHRDALPLVPIASTRVGIIRFPQPARSLLRSIPNRYRSPAGGVLTQVSAIPEH